MAGAVAVLEPGTPGLNVSVDGHVMDVVSVSGDSVVVRDMNWNYKPFQTTTHTLAASSISGYIYPPGGIAPSSSIAASDLASTTPSSGGLTWADILGGFGPGGMIIGNNPSAVGPAVSGVFGGILGAILQPVVKGGEVLIGFIAILAGMFILVKHSSAGNNVINVATQTAKTGAKLAAL
jgi:surface antigen